VVVCTVHSYELSAQGNLFVEFQICGPVFELDACGGGGSVDRHRSGLLRAALYRKTVATKGINTLGSMGQNVTY
jgi:hypothetical protein